MSLWPFTAGSAACEAGVNGGTTAVDGDCGLRIRGATCAGVAWGRTLTEGGIGGGLIPLGRRSAQMWQVSREAQLRWHEHAGQDQRGKRFAFSWSVKTGGCPRLLVTLVHAGVGAPSEEGDR